MSKALSLKLQDSVFEDLEEITGYLNTSRNRYINKALEYFNRVNRKQMLKKQMIKESAVTQKTSIEVLGDFEALNDNFFEW